MIGCDCGCVVAVVDDVAVCPAVTFWPAVCVVVCEAVVEAAVEVGVVVLDDAVVVALVS